MSFQNMKTGMFTIFGNINVAYMDKLDAVFGILDSFFGLLHCNLLLIEKTEKIEKRGIILVLFMLLICSIYGLLTPAFTRHQMINILWALGPPVFDRTALFFGFTSVDTQSLVKAYPYIIKMVTSMLVISYIMWTKGGRILDIGAYFFIKDIISIISKKETVSTKLKDDFYDSDEELEDLDELDELD